MEKSQLNSQSTDLINIFSHYSIQNNTSSQEQTIFTNKFRKGEILFRYQSPASYVFWIRKGLVKLHLEENINVILKVNGPGSYIGLKSIFDGPLYHYTSTAITPVEAELMEINACKQLIYNNPEFASKILGLISQETLFYLKRFVTQSQKQMPGRVAYTLLYFYNLLGKNRSFQLPLSRAELAFFAGITKESFIRTLTEFKNDRIIDVNIRQITINNLDIIKTLSQIG